MAEAAMLLAGLLILTVSFAFLLVRFMHRRRLYDDDLTPVARQHIELFQGGQLNEAAVEATKMRLRALLERGELEAVEASMRPGMNYIFHVRALTEIGTDDAGRILERQLQRRLSENLLEQSWYWIDLANGLRSLNREQSLPHLLRCAETAGESPLGPFFAAETVCFLGFSGYVRQPESPLGRSALRVLRRALEGLRCGVPPQTVIEARLGETVENLWDHRTEHVCPLTARVFIEALRLLKRAPHAELALREESSDHEAFLMQMSRLAALEPVLSDYIGEAPSLLSAAFAKASEAEQRDILQAMNDLRADTASIVLPFLKNSRSPHCELAVTTLMWSRDPKVGLWLRDWAIEQVQVVRRAQKRRRVLPPRRSSVPAHVPYQAVLKAMRGHPSRDTELFLLLAARDWDPTFRAAAVGSLGWWEPILRVEVLMTLQQTILDPNPEVRQSARAALARLGQRQALQWFRQILNADDNQRVHEAIQVVAHEGITLLWADLDQLADSEDIDIAIHARETLERLCEDMDKRSH